MELLPLVCLCLLSCSGDGLKVEEGSDAVLPCFIITEEDISGEIVGWRKDGQDVLFHDPSGHRRQGAKFKGRVSFVDDQLKNGDASMKITNTKRADSGTYSCIYPHPEPIAPLYITLVVGVSPQLSITTLNQTVDGLLLQCVVRGASIEPTVRWTDSSGNILPAEQPQVTKRGDLFDVTLQITVTKTDHYRCVSRQVDIRYNIYAETFAPVHVSGSNTGWIVGFVVVSLLLVVAAVFHFKDLISRISAKGSTPNTTNGKPYADQTTAMIESVLV